MAGKCLAVGLVCACLFSCGRLFLIAAFFSSSFDWHQLICADAKLLLVMGIDDNVSEIKTVTSSSSRRRRSLIAVTCYC